MRFSNRTSCILDKMPMLHSHLSVPGPLASSPDPCPFVHTHQRIDRAGGSLSRGPCPCLASRSPPPLITCPRDRGYLQWGQGGKRGRPPARARQFSAVASFCKHRHIARGNLQPQSESSTAKVTGPGPQAFQAAEGGRHSLPRWASEPHGRSTGLFLRLPFWSSCPASLLGCGHAWQPLGEPGPGSPCSAGCEPGQGISEQEAESTRGRGPGRKCGSSVLFEQEMSTMGCLPRPVRGATQESWKGNCLLTNPLILPPSKAREGALGINPGCLRIGTERSVPDGRGCLVGPQPCLSNPVLSQVTLLL